MAGVRGRRYLVILAILAGLVGLYAAVGFLLVPRWIRSELVGVVARDFGRTLSVGDVSFNPFTWTLDISDFSLPDADGRPMISFGHLEVVVAASSVPQLAPNLSEIILDSPHVNAVVRRDGKLNLADLEKPFAQPAQSNTAPDSKPLKLLVDRLAVSNGSATYEDDSRSAPFRLDLNPIGFELLNFSTTGNTAGSYHLTATIGQGGRLDWMGTIRAQPISLRGTLKLDDLSARTVATYLGPVLPAEVSRGTLALQGNFAIERVANGSSSPAIRMTVDVPRAQVSGLGVRPRQAASDYIGLNRLTLGNAHIDLEQRTIRVGRITLAGADVRGWLDQGGKLNLLDLLGHAAPAHPATPRPSASRAPLWRIAAPDIRIENTRVSMEDRGIKPTARLTLSAVAARITGYDSSARSRLNVSLQSAVNGKGKLQLTAQGTLDPEALSAKLDLHRIDLRALQPYLNRYTALTLASGFLNTQLDIERGADGNFSSAGRISIVNLRTVDDDLKQDFVKWQGLHIVGFRYASNPASLHVEHVVAVAPYARVIIGADHTLNVSEALHPRGYHAKQAATKTPQTRDEQAQTANGQVAPASGNEAPPASSKPAMAMSIGQIRIANGTADYADFSMQPNFSAGIQDLHGTIKGLSSEQSSRATVDLEGRVDRYAPVEISGVVNLLAATTYSDIRMKFRDLQLTQMTPYSVRFAGYKIASGTLDADLHYKVDHGVLNAEHTLIINQLQLGEQVASPHAVKLPLRLAIALLKDRDGVIRIGLPVTGSLNNPQFSLGPLIAKALLNVLKKAVTAPFALLGRAFGGGPDLNRIDFAPGSATLLPAAQTRVAALAKALTQRPQLTLQVPAVYAADVDRPALARRQLRKELIELARSGAGRRNDQNKNKRNGKQKPAPKAGREVLELPGEHYRLLRAAYQNAFGAKAPLPAAAQKVPPYEPAILELQSALLTHITVSDSDLQALGEKRAEAIRAAIVSGGTSGVGTAGTGASGSSGGVSASRVVITPAKPESATDGKVAVKLGLK